MNVNFEYHNVSASNRLEILAAEKLSKLEEKFDFMVSSDVYFKKENRSGENTGKICSVRVNTPGPTLFAESSSTAFEVSIASVMSDLQRQLQKRKDKMQSR
ncbi:ribosome hibernation-promoting factor, HPF/YfiA family [Ulvibacter antarcticus]|uniref:Putative sigma-54 modulation protein n=1 Tax=Ulvibacter antarcticus TaxID=442714 RepID=A0A3L9Z1Q1_9FLAO|nr:ribosome-associated translation inhibitor RaiA [Ulvibacter antarcticus]RMA64278.1 putative sigma-54 modulation protein [Ulvibacter antarcticus]